MSGIARILIGDRFGRLIGEMRPGVLDSVTWRFGIGEASLSLAYGSPELSRDLVEFGNRIYVEFSNGLPPWGGVFDPPRKWGREQVTITAYSGEHLFTWRICGTELRFDGFSAGQIVRQLITEANAADDLGLRAGQIWESGPPQSLTYHIRNLWAILEKDLVDEKLIELLVVPEITNGAIQFVVNAYARAGIPTEAALILGRNVDDDATLIEQGPILNDRRLAGADTSVLLSTERWGETRLLSLAVDQASAARYRLRQAGEVMPQIEQQTALDELARVKLNDESSPKLMWDLYAGNVEPGTFDQYGLGDTVTLVAPGYGFEGDVHHVRLLSREFAPATGLCRLIVQEE